VALVLAGCGGRPAPQTVWIGHLAALTGPGREAGQHARQGVQVAVGLARADGARLGNRPIAVVHADTRGEADLVQPEAVRLLTVNKVAALLAGPSAADVPHLLRAAEPYGASLVVPGEMPEGVAGPGVVALGATSENRGRVLARFAADELKAGKAVVLTDGRDPIAPAVAAAFVKEWRSGRRTAQEWTYTTAVQHDEAMTRLTGAKPDLIVGACSAGDFGLLRERIAAAGVHAPLVYAGQDVGAAPLPALRQETTDVYLATAYSSEKMTEQGREFARRYEADFHEPPDLYAASAYDGTRLLIEVLRRAQTTAPDKVRQELERTDRFDSLTGPVTWEKGRQRRALFLVRLREGIARLLRTVEPGP
jgi:branched-chain amino acid transport system substrate-binding protein